MLYKAQSHLRQARLQKRLGQGRATDGTFCGMIIGMIWKRHDNGDGTTSWTRTIGQTNVVVANMQGQSVRFSGLGAHVLVWVSDLQATPHDLNRREVKREWTVADAKAWAQSRYAAEGHGQP